MRRVCTLALFITLGENIILMALDEEEWLSNIGARAHFFQHFDNLHSHAQIFCVR